MLEYWLVDYEAKTIEIYNLAEGVYTLSGNYTPGQVATSTQLAGFQVAVAAIFNF